MSDRTLAPIRVLIVSPYPELANDCAFMVRSHLDCDIYECFNGENLHQQLELTAVYEMMIFIKTPELYDSFKIKFPGYKCSYILNYNQSSNYHKSIEEFLLKLKDRFLHKEYTPVFYKLLLFHGYLPTDTYIKLSDEKMIKFLPAKSIVKRADIEHLIGFGLEYFYIRSSDLKGFKKFSRKNIETYILELSVQNEEVVEVFKKCKFLSKDTFSNLNAMSMATYDSHFMSGLKICFANKNLKAELEKKMTANPYYPIHMYMVGLIASRIISHMGSEGRIAHTLIAFSALIHDLGLSTDTQAESELIKELTQGKFDADPVSSDDIIHHGEKVLQWIMPIECLPDWVHELCLKHHERPNGTGFPVGEDIKKYNYLPAVFIVSHMVFDNLYTLRNSGVPYKKILSGFNLKDFKNGQLRDIALHVELLDIF